MREDGQVTSKSDPVGEARVAIWRLFQEGYVDEDMATASLLAVDLGTRRAQRNWPSHLVHHERTERED
jgi:hypothetical protein